MTNTTPSQSMSAFFTREDVRALQDIQKRNPFDSVVHQNATAEIIHLAELIGAGQYFEPLTD